jgi:hypothetical protein
MPLRYRLRMRYADIICAMRRAFIRCHECHEHFPARAPRDRHLRFHH